MHRDFACTSVKLKLNPCLSISFDANPYGFDKIGDGILDYSKGLVVNPIMMIHE